MIDFLRGNIANRTDDSIVIDVHGVGYRVFCANPYSFGPSDENITVFTHYHVREDATLLYGFSSREEQSLFRLLIEVSGIGPKVALGILSGGRPEALIAAISQENLTFLTKLPGIGKKTAQRLVLDLKDKLQSHPLGQKEAAAAGWGDISIPSTGNAGGGVWLEAKEALMALGYTETELDKIAPALKAKLNEDDPADVWVKQALQALFRG